MPPAEPLTVAGALAEGRAALREAGSPTPRLDAEVLLGHVLGRDRAWLLAHPEAAVDAGAAWTDALARRATGEPVAYIRGFKEWRSLCVRTDARALVPRPETELLADAAVAEIARRLTADEATIVAWDVATGSGAVAVVLALRFRSAIALGRLRLVASDVSADALELASENLEAHGVSSLVDLACADLLDPTGDVLPRSDVVVANLPYVPRAEVDAGAGSLAHEPRLALDGGPDGLEVIRRLLRQLPDRAAPSVTALLEVGAGQADAVAALAPPGATVGVDADLAGIGRVVRIGMADSAA